MFYSGQKVVCIYAAARCGMPSPLLDGEVYTVLRMHDCGCGGCSNVPGVLLVEVKPPSWHCSFLAGRFRPAVTKKTDISVFRVKELEDA